MRTLVFITGFVCSCSLAMAQYAFQQHFVNGNGGQYLSESVIQTSDGGYLISGAYQYFPWDTTGVLLLKTDAQGNINFSYVLSGYSVFENKIISRSGGGFYLLTSIIDSTNLQYEKRAVIFSFNDSLVPYWSKSFLLEPTSFQQKYMMETTDSSVLVSVNGTVARLTRNGDFVWCKLFTNDSLNQSAIYSFVCGSDGAIYFAAELNTYNSPHDLMTIFKTNYHGNIIWSVQIDDSLNFFTPGPKAIAIKITDSNNLLLGGNYGRYFTSSPLLMKTDTAGNIIWSKFYDPVSNYHGSFDYLEFAASNSMVVGGSVCLTNQLLDYKIVLATSDSDGNFSFAKCYGRQSAPYKYAKGFLKTNDNGFAAVSSTMYLVKTDSLFNSNCYEWPMSFSLNNGYFHSKGANLYAVKISDTSGTYPATFDHTSLITGPCAVLPVNEWMQQNNTVSVNPNPSKGIVSFEINNGANAISLFIYDISGRLIYSNLSPVPYLQIPIQQQGIFAYRVIYNNGATVSGKFIVD